MLIDYINHLALFQYIGGLLIWFFLLIYKPTFEEMYVMTPTLFPDIANWSDSKLGLILNCL